MTPHDWYTTGAVLFGAVPVAAALVWFIRASGRENRE